MLKHYPKLRKHRIGSKPFLKELSKIIIKNSNKTNKNGNIDAMLNVIYKGD